MSDSQGNEDFSSATGSGPWKPLRSIALMIGLVVLIYFSKHGPFPNLQVPHWVVAAALGAMSAFFGFMNLSTGTAWVPHSSVSRSEEPGLYWIQTCLDLLFGAVLLVTATGEAVGLWTVR